MEEDIKILEKINESFRENYSENCNLLEPHKLETIRRKSEAIDNILIRLKQLEKQNINKEDLSYREIALRLTEASISASPTNNAYAIGCRYRDIFKTISGGNNE